jgi:hypothetical protein
MRLEDGRSRGSRLARNGRLGSAAEGAGETVRLWGYMGTRYGSASRMSMYQSTAQITTIIIRDPVRHLSVGSLESPNDGSCSLRMIRGGSCIPPAYRIAGGVAYLGDRSWRLRLL